MMMLTLLEARFRDHPERHEGLAWETVAARLSADPEALRVLEKMEATGGEPDVIGASPSGAVLFCDCSPETPAGRRSLCYDDAALKARKKNPPEGSAMEQARAMGVTLLTEEAYRKLQTLGEFDLKTSSWVKTPDAIRKQGGAIFCERRYGEVFTFHNGADSYYSVRGWRGELRV